MRNLYNYKLKLRRQTVKSSSDCNATCNYGSDKQKATTSMSSLDMERCLEHILDRKFQDLVSNFELAE
jgi:hypothetical protein